MQIAYDLRGVEEKYREVVLAAIKCMEEVIPSEEFMQALIDEIFLSNGLEGELSEWKYSTPELIYKQLLPIKLELRTYYSIKNVIGFGYPNDATIYLNTKYLGRYKVDNLEDLMSIGSNLLHEHSHDCGFEHDFYNTSKRKNSISYLLNRVYERAFREVYNLGNSEPPRGTYIPWWKRLFNRLRRVFRTRTYKLPRLLGRRSL